MKKVFFTYCLLFTICCYAQQTPQFTQYMLNSYGLNPANCGLSSNKYEALVGIRRQWIGLPDAPQTEFFNFNTFLGKKATFKRGWHAIGAGWEGDRQGLIYHSDNFYGSYTYHLRTSRYYYMAFGIAAGARRYGLTVPLGSIDPVLVSKNIWLYPDFIPGIKLYNNKWLFDLSAMQLYKNKAKQGGSMIGSPIDLSPSLYFTASHKWWARSYLLVMQSIHIKYTPSSLPAIEYDMLAYLNKYFAIGITYRNLDAICGIIQYRFDKLVIGFAYDYTIAPYRFGFANSQELMLGIAPSPFSGGADDVKHYRTAECPNFQY